MMYSLAADAVLVLHLVFIVFALLGGLLAVWKPWWILAHLPAAGWAVWIEWSGGLCPLTPWENQLRAAAGEAGYPGSFIGHYLVPVIYPPGLTRELQFVFGALALAINVLVYVQVIRYWRRNAAQSDSRGST